MQAAAGAEARAMRWRRGRVLYACAVAAALWLACGGRGGGGRAARVELSARREYPRRAPHALAHLLADFSTLPHFAPHEPDPGSWRVEEERGNYTSWVYQVAWTCGARCSGRARVSAHTSPPHPGVPPAHAPQQRAAHRVTLELRLCADSSSPAAPCDEMEIRADVEPDGTGGAVLRERAVASCAGDAGQPGGGQDTCAARLRRHRALHQDALAAPAAPAA